jgi:hypothetical protein
MDIANTCIANQSPTHCQHTHRLIGCFAIQASEEPEKIKVMMTTTDRETLLSQLLIPTHTHELHKSLVKKLSGLPKTILRKAALEHQ